MSSPEMFPLINMVALMAVGKGLRILLLPPDRKGRERWKMAAAAEAANQSRQLIL
jgi:hypothetical protein